MIMIEFIDFKSFIIENGQLIATLLALLTAIVSLWGELAKVFRRIKKWFGVKKEAKVLLEEFELRTNHGEELSSKFNYKNSNLKGMALRPTRKLIKEIGFDVELTISRVGQDRRKDLTIKVNPKGFIQFGKYNTGYYLYKPRMVDAKITLKLEENNYILFGKIGHEEIVYELLITKIYDQNRLLLRLTKYPKGYQRDLNQHLNLFESSSLTKTLNNITLNSPR